MSEILPIEGQRCLVTGASGFVGRNLVRALLERGCDVHGFDRAEPPFEESKLSWFRGDIRNESEVAAACENVDVIFHTAALIETYTYAPATLGELVRSVNIQGTRVLLKAAEEAGVKRLVHTSSVVTVCGPETRNVSESRAYSESKDLYSATKVESERLVLDANGKGGLFTCAIRPGGIYGPGERHIMIGPMVEALKQGFPVVSFGKGDAVMDYTYIDNLVDAQLRAAERLFEGSPVCGEAYFVTDGQPINTGAFSMELVQHMGLDARHVRVPKLVASAVATAGERLFKALGKPKPPFSIIDVRLCVNDHYFSIDKAKRDLAYRPLVDTHEGLRKTAIDAREYYDSLSGSVKKRAARP